jgi:hypothetical protein
MNHDPMPTATSAVRTPHPDELCTFLIDLPSGGVDLVVDAATFDQLRTATRPSGCILSTLQSRMILARTVDYGRRVIRLDSPTHVLDLAEHLIANDNFSAALVLLAFELRDLVDPAMTTVGS